MRPTHYFVPKKIEKQMCSFSPMDKTVTSQQCFQIPTIFGILYCSFFSGTHSMHLHVLRGVDRRQVTVNESNMGHHLDVNQGLI